MYRNAPRSMREILESTRQFADRDFMIYSERDDQRLKQKLRGGAGPTSSWRKGVRKGDRVAIGMRNYPEWITSFWACRAMRRCRRCDKQPGGPS
jgi:long-chain acyl-CoA synthetase